MSDLVERVAKAIEDAQLLWSIRLTRLVDGESTYELRYDGCEKALEFSSHDEALEHLTAVKRRVAARAAIAAMREPSEAMVSESEAAIFEYTAEPRDWTLQAAKDGWQAGIDAALSEPADQPETAFRGQSYEDWIHG